MKDPAAGEVSSDHRAPILFCTAEYSSVLERVIVWQAHGPPNGQPYANCRIFIWNRGLHELAHCLHRGVAENRGDLPCDVVISPSLLSLTQPAWRSQLRQSRSRYRRYAGGSRRAFPRVWIRFTAAVSSSP